ncbi:MAG TPA: TIGR03086 family metal-binding protein [Egibacteraceae bacterium]
MSEIAQRYTRLADRFAATIAAVPTDRWSAPSPCEGWTARDVVRHVVDTQGLFLGFVGRDLGDVGSVDDDPLGTWEAAAKVVRAELEDPERAAATYEGMFGIARFEESVDRYLSFDLVIHRWDLARATGVDERIPPEDLAWATARAHELGEQARRQGVFGPALEPPPGADEQTRLLAFVGRRAW